MWTSRISELQAAFRLMTALKAATLTRAPSMPSWRASKSSLSIYRDTSELCLIIVPIRASNQKVAQIIKAKESLVISNKSRVSMTMTLCNVLPSVRYCTHPIF